MTRLLMIVGIGILGYVGTTYYQTGRAPNLPSFLGGSGGGAFAGGYGMAVDSARSVGSGMSGLASGVAGRIGN